MEKMLGSLRNGYVVPAVVGVIALVMAGYLAWLTVRGDDVGSARRGDSGATATPTTPALAVRRVVNQAGGYSVAVPKGLKATRKGPATTIVDRAHTMSVVISPTPRGALAANNRAVLKTMRSSYRRVSLLTSQKQRVDGRPAVVSYGRAVTRKQVRLRFVLTTVKGPKRNFAISTFAAADSNPTKVLPRVRAITNGFRVGTGRG